MKSCEILGNPSRVATGGLPREAPALSGRGPRGAVERYSAASLSGALAGDPLGGGALAGDPRGRRRRDHDFLEISFKIFLGSFTEPPDCDSECELMSRCIRMTEGIYPGRVLGSPRK